MTRTDLALVPEDKKIWAPRKLDIACGQRKGLDPFGVQQKGFTGIDLGGGGEIEHDLFDYPWPIKTGSVKEAQCHHFVEHIPHEAPRRITDDWEFDGWFMFFAEVHRILADGATISLLHPYSRSDRAFWDPTHTRYIHEAAYLYLNRKWRTENKLEHYMPDVDFEIISVDGMLLPEEVMMRPEEYQTHARTFWFNVVNDLRVVLKVVKT